MSNFEELNWHDNAIHGFHIREGEDNCNGELDFDIDYILEWIAPVDNTFSFRVAPAILTFHDVSDLIISINYASATAVVQPMTIHEIHREVKNYQNGYSSFNWKVEINWPPQSFFTFTSSSFSQTIYGQQIISGAQYLQPSERNRL